jgi:hypothetical protein
MSPMGKMKLLQSRLITLVFMVIIKVGKSNFMRVMVIYKH